MFYSSSSFLLFLIVPLIKSCPLKTVDSRSGCYCGIEIDGTNYIQCQPYSINQIPEFTRSYVHDKLNLSFNFIRNITHQSFHQLKVKKIYLQQNLLESIEPQAFNDHLLNYLEELHLDVLNNGSLEFLCYGSWNKLRVLALKGFNFQQYDSCLEKFHRLERLIIQHSRIEQFPQVFFKLPHLMELSLVNNQLEYLQIDLDLSVSSSSIKIFNLTHNQLRTIPNDLFQRMPQLQILDLSHNLFEHLPIIQINHFLHVNLSSNLINYLQLNDRQNSYDVTFNPLCTVEKNVAKHQFLLGQSTRLHCDCRLAVFLNESWFNQSKLIGDNQSFGNETRCFTPLAYQGLFLKDLTYAQLLSTCTDDLPSNCREVNHFKNIQKHAYESISTTTEGMRKFCSKSHFFRLYGCSQYRDGKAHSIV